MNIGYVVLHYIYNNLTDACLASIRQHDLNAKILVVDNGSPEPYRCTAPVLHLQTNCSLAAAMNLGTQHLLLTSAVDIALQLNNDVLLTGCTARELAWAFGSHAQLGVASVMMDQVDADFAYFGCPYEPGPGAEHFLANNLPRHRLLVVPFVDNVAFAIRREVWEQVGCLEERFTGASWGANYDYCWRARQAGWIVGLVKSAFLFHRHRATWKTLDPNYFENSVQRMMSEAFAVWGEDAPKVLWRGQNWRPEFLGEDA